MTPLELIKSNYWPLIVKASDEHKISKELIAAIIISESNGETNAVRFEPGTYVNGRGTFARPPIGIKYPTICSSETEAVMRCCSFGLMQVMGFNARANGHTTWLHELCVPEVGIRHGCLILKSCLTRWPKFEDAASAYNHGSPWKLVQGGYQNQVYVDHVMTFFNIFRQMEV